MTDHKPTRRTNWQRFCELEATAFEMDRVAAEMRMLAAKTNPQSTPEERESAIASARGSIEHATKMAEAYREMVFEFPLNLTEAA